MYMYAYFLVPWYPPGQKSHIKKIIPPLDRTDGHPSIPPWFPRGGAINTRCGVAILA